jgi:hypothetical protein
MCHAHACRTDRAALWRLLGATLQRRFGFAVEES